MNIDEYVKNRLAALDQETTQVKDFRVFDFSWVPDEPLIRDEATPIIDGLLKYARTGIAQNMILLGSRGCGKTLLMRYLQRVLKEKVGLRMLYANCRNDNSSFKILASFLGASQRGTSLHDLYDRFEARYDGPTVVILDEVDLISKKDPNKDVLYFLSRSERGYMVVCLSNNPNLLAELDSSVRSSLQAETVYLKNYDASQVAEILTMRARSGLRSWSEAEVAQIAGLVVQRTNSDVRVAIKCLFYTITGGGDQSIEASLDHAQRDVYVDLIADLSSRNLLILKAAQETPDRYVRRVFRTYERLSLAVGETSYSYVYFLNNLSYLQSLGLVLLVHTKVNRTYTKMVTLLFAERVLETTFRKRFEQPVCGVNA